MQVIKDISKLFLIIFLLISITYAEPQKGKWSFEYQTGVMFSPVIVHTGMSDFNFWQSNLRFCRILTGLLNKNNLLRGDLEGIIEFSASSIVEGKGSFIFGCGPILRYNFLRPKWRIIPYVQAGGGICYTDAYYYEAIGQGFNFTLQLGIGAKYMLNSHWSLDIETRYNHISNAGMDHRNKGINAIGATIGFSYYF